MRGREKEMPWPLLYHGGCSGVAKFDLDGNGRVASDASGGFAAAVSGNIAAVAGEDMRKKMNSCSENERKGKEIK